ncbi:transcription factor tga1 [Nicotiana attenuata]|uniref:Transcription factor tga1 n=1 Tax=Nicotiana attenuata TaxID=49451 RepID=A0A1J6HZ48_NICAT|nr:transcription factor tga1 [Nicotiana attenuata]
MEYGRWLEDQHRLMCELRSAILQEHLPDNQLGMYFANCVTHYDDIMNLKSMLAKSDVFHLVSGMWKTPAQSAVSFGSEISGHPTSLKYVKKEFSIYTLLYSIM